MLYTDFIEKMLGLQDVNVTKMKNNENAVCIYAETVTATENPFVLEIVVHLFYPVSASAEKNKKPLKLLHFNGFKLVGRDGFEPSKSLTADLQSAPFGHSGTYPYKVFWSWWTDSNPRPADYKSAALPTELHQHTGVSSTLE